MILGSVSERVPWILKTEGILVPLFPPSIDPSDQNMRSKLRLLNYLVGLVYVKVLKAKAN